MVGFPHLFFSLSTQGGSLQRDDSIDALRLLEKVARQAHVAVISNTEEDFKKLVEVRRSPLFSFPHSSGVGLPCFATRLQVNVHFYKVSRHVRRRLYLAVSHSACRVARDGCTTLSCDPAPVVLCRPVPWTSCSPPSVSRRTGSTSLPQSGSTRCSHLPTPTSALTVATQCSRASR